MIRTAFGIAGFGIALAAFSSTPQVAPDGMKALEHVRVLAAQEMRGRKSATPEYRKAAEYVAAKMKEYGLAPAGDKGSYFQEVPFKAWSNYDPPTRLELVAPLKRSYVPGRGHDFVPVYGTGSGTARGSVLFAGYGINSSKPAWNDYENVDPRGRVVVVMPEAPKMFGDPGGEWTLEKKAKQALEKGAVGLIEMDVADPGPTAGSRRGARSIVSGALPPGFVVLRAGSSVLDELFYFGRSSWRDAASKILRLQKPHSFALDVSLEMEAHFLREDRLSFNVLGKIPGTDPKRKDEALILGGHLDHLGTSLDGLVLPGADDNASAVAVILETARVLKASGFKPRRTLIFAAWAGEEMGCVGSRFYTEHPSVPLGRTACYMNVDMVGTGDGDLLIGGLAEQTRFFDLIRPRLEPEIAARLKPRLAYYGSDHTSFWNKGVAAISLRTGDILTEKLDDEHPEYHRPGDRPEAVDPELLALAVRYQREVIQALAETKENLFAPRFRAEFIHKDAAVVDLHADTISRYMAGEDLRRDLPSGHIDIPKLKRGAVDLQVFACFAPPPADELEKARSAKGVFDQVEAVYRLVRENPEDLEVVLAPADFSRLRNMGKTGILIGIEGGYAIQDDLDLLRAFHRAGVRLMTLTHWTHTGWADASGDSQPVWNGLTEFGKSVVREMNALGMIIDVSHAHDKTFWDVLAATKAPVVASHSCCRSLADHFRNLTDDQLKALAKNNGMVGINYAPGFLDAASDNKRQALWEETAKRHGLPPDYREGLRADPQKTNRGWADFDARLAALEKTLPPVDIRRVADHIDHVVRVTGSPNHVGLGSDFDGIGSTPAGLENAGKLLAVTDELVRRGYKEEAIRRILGGNFVRVWNDILRAAGK